MEEKLLYGVVLLTESKQPQYIASKTAIGKPSPFDKEMKTSASSICSIAVFLGRQPLKEILIDGTTFLNNQLSFVYLLHLLKRLFLLLYCMNLIPLEVLSDFLYQIREPT